MPEAFRMGKPSESMAMAVDWRRCVDEGAEAAPPPAACGRVRLGVCLGSVREQTLRLPAGLRRSKTQNQPAGLPAWIPGVPAQSLVRRSQ